MTGTACHLQEGLSHHQKIHQKESSSLASIRTECYKMFIKKYGQSGTFCTPMNSLVITALPREGESALMETCQPDQN